MITIKIKRDSIKKNPNAGNTSSIIQGLKEAKFKIESYSIPDIIKNEPFFITEFTEENGVLTSASGVINGPITPDQFSEWMLIQGISITISNNTRVIHHMPEPDYLFEYEDTEVKCRHCKNMVDVDSIEQDEFGGDLLNICPICGHENTFPEYKYEKIGDVVKG